MKKFEWNYPHRSLQGAELAALQLQHKISKHLSSFLQTPTADPTPSWIPEAQSLASSLNQSQTPKLDDGAQLEERGQAPEAEDKASALSASPPVSLLSVDALVSELSTSAHLQPPAAREAAPREASGAERAETLQGEGSASERDGRNGLEEKVEGLRIGESGSKDGPGDDTSVGDNPVGVSEWMERQESLARNWDRTLEHITALSLVKFASLLLEIVAKMTFVIERGEALALDARFAMGTNVQ